LRSIGEVLDLYLSLPGVAAKAFISIFPIKLALYKSYVQSIENNPTDSEGATTTLDVTEI
jgi:hypothetical protein